VEAHLFCPWCGGALVTDGRAQRCTICDRTHHRDPKVGVGVVVRDTHGRLLLVRRGIQPGLGRWSLPAGYVDADEDPRAAAARECLEEAGLVVEVGAVCGVYPRPPAGRRSSSRLPRPSSGGRSRPVTTRPTPGISRTPICRRWPSRAPAPQPVSPTD